MKNQKIEDVRDNQTSVRKSWVDPKVTVYTLVFFGALLLNIFGMPFFPETTPLLATLHQIAHIALYVVMLYTFIGGLMVDAVGRAMAEMNPEFHFQFSEERIARMGMEDAMLKLVERLSKKIKNNTWKRDPILSLLIDRYEKEKAKAERVMHGISKLRTFRKDQLIDYLAYHDIELDEELRQNSDKKTLLAMIDDNRLIKKTRKASKKSKK